MFEIAAGIVLGFFAIWAILAVCNVLIVMVPALFTLAKEGAREVWKTLGDVHWKRLIVGILDSFFGLFLMIVFLSWLLAVMSLTNTVPSTNQDRTAFTVSAVLLGVMALLWYLRIRRKHPRIINRSNLSYVDGLLDAIVFLFGIAIFFGWVLWMVDLPVARTLLRHKVEWATIQITASFAYRFLRRKIPTPQFRSQHPSPQL